MYAAELRDALALAVRGVPEQELAAATSELVDRYRSVAAASAPILATRTRVLAYASYRMPATHAALVRVLAAVADTAPGLTPRSLLDIGGGTGAAAWAAAGVFDSLERITVVDQATEALDLGRRLTESTAAGSVAPALRTARFDHAAIGSLPEGIADLVTVSYVLSELTAGQQSSVVREAQQRGPVVVIAEPGTPDGYLRVLSARDALLASGWRLLGPCPHSAKCPLPQGDWCHFAARVNRSAEHRRLKGGELSYEDEKFSWVAAAHPDVVGSLAVQPGSGRILRHPVKRKGFVEFRVCRPDESVGREVVSKKAGARYRAARDAAWGDELPD